MRLRQLLTHFALDPPEVDANSRLLTLSSFGHAGLAIREQTTLMFLQATSGFPCTARRDHDQLLLQYSSSRTAVSLAESELELKLELELDRSVAAPVYCIPARTLAYANCFRWYTSFSGCALYLFAASRMIICHKFEFKSNLNCNLYHVYHETFKLGDPTDEVEHDDGVHVGLVTATVVPEAAAAAADNEEH